MQRWIVWFALLVIGVLGTASQSRAAMVTYFGSTQGGSVWNRPNAGIPPLPPVSGIGTAVPFSMQEFTVSQSGLYDFLSSSVTPSSWDNNLYLYQASFNPLSSLNNVVAGSDDFPDIGVSGFNGVNLVAATNYFLVTTGFTNVSAGSYSNTISGPGNIALISIPEPSSLVLCGITTCLILVRRRRSSGLMNSANS